MPGQTNQPNPDILTEPRFRKVAQKYNENSDSDEDLADLESMCVPFIFLVKIFC